MAFVSQINLTQLHKSSATQIRGLREKDFYRSFEASETFTFLDTGVFNDLTTKDPGPEALPAITECAAHLEMLEVFRAMRDTVIQSADLDAVFGIYPKNRTVYRKKYRFRSYYAEAVNIRDATFELRRQNKWPFYLNLAVARFHHWIEMVDTYIGQEKASEFLLLPPLDVLMVWHAFLLNPSSFANYCSKYQLKNIQGIAFPWSLVHSAIDHEEWTYTLPLAHATWLLNETQIEPDLIEILKHCALIDSGARSILTKAGNSWSKTVRTPSRSKDERDNRFAQTAMTAWKDERANSPLVQNIVRQSVFVDKMHAHRWIRSPAAEGTLRRAINRYAKFVDLFRIYPKTFLVPTLDVDLVWHTHQCSASNYREFVTRRAGQFINHEDKIGRSTLDNGFTRTEECYRAQFGEEYQVCLCWSCEAILSAVEERNRDGDDEDEEGIIEDIVPNVEALVDEVEKKVLYYREAEVRRKLKKRHPTRN